MTWRPSRALDLPQTLLPELQRFKDAVRCAALGELGPRALSRTTYANLDCPFAECALVFVVPKKWEIPRGPP